MNRIILILTLLILSSPSLADWKLEHRKIDFLLKKVETSKAIFIRNGDEHSAKEAADHLRLKLKNSQTGWFFYTPKEEWTVGLFIKKIASKSSLSGKPYKIRLNNGKTYLTSEWLHSQLNAFKP